MMQKSLVWVAVLSAALPALVLTAQEPAKQVKAPETNVAALEVRADQHFLGGEWADALPMYKKLQGMLKDQPDKLGPVEERIRVCEKNIAKLAKVSPSQAGKAAPVANPVTIPAAPPTAEQRKPLP